MNHDQFSDWLASRGLIRTLRLYDSALGSDLESEFDEHLQEVIELATATVNEEDPSRE